MQGLSWLLAVVILCACGPEVDGQCRDIADCADLGSKEKIMECICVLPNQQQSTAEEEEKESLSLGVLLSSLAQDDGLQAKRSNLGPLRTDDRRSYSMEHFRWGKPMGRKRRPVKVYTGGSEEGSPEDQSVEAHLPLQNRRQLDSREDGAPTQKKNAKNTEKYRMTHFRWNAPPAAKRYGGFMKPWSEKSNKPFLTLLRNIIIKDGQ
ncbi:proopiomelanocortin b [Salminus brasiliensis]|uniref:proopiomelanocortin b n=1 Tax=Salminus brasiliensis TaxID=930266 RepID=UPI003B82EAB0